MLVLKNKIWLGCTLLFLFHQLSQKAFGFDAGWIDNYLDPLLSMPILLGLLLQERQFIITKYFSQKHPTTYRLSILEITIATLFFAIIFEEGFPKWSSHFTKDYWDYLAYFIGAFIFSIFINKKNID